MSTSIKVVIEARFLRGQYHGIEWPPSPMRLLQALVAGNRGIRHPGLAWLETAGKPEIIADTSPPSSVVRGYVDTNTPQRGNDPLAREKTEKVFRSRRLRHTVRYVWNVGTDIDEATLADLVAKLHTLGTGHDPVSARVYISQGAVTIPEGCVRFVPWDFHLALSSLRELRVPVQGSLSSIETTYKRWVDRKRLLEVGRDYPLYEPVKYAPYAPVAGKITAVFDLKEPGSLKRPAAFSPGQAIVLAGMMRHALHNETRRAFPGDDDLAAMVSGHTKNRGRVASYLPLPSVGHAHADGRIRRIMVLMPVIGAEQQDRITLLVSQGLNLVMETGEVVAVAEPAVDTAGFVDAHYLAESAVWESVTPVILPGNHCPKPKCVDKLIIKALREADFSEHEVRWVLTDRRPFRKPARHAFDYRLKQITSAGGQLCQLHPYHVRVAFTRPVKGPLAIGRLKNAGLGVMVPCANPK